MRTTVLFGRQAADEPAWDIKPVFTHILSGQSEWINAMELFFTSNVIFGISGRENLVCRENQ